MDGPLWMIRVCMRDYGFWFAVMMMMMMFSKATQLFFCVGREKTDRRRIGDGSGRRWVVTVVTVTVVMDWDRDRGRVVRVVCRWIK